MKKLIFAFLFFLICLLFSIVPTQAQPGFGNPVRINDSWMFYLNSTDTVAVLPEINANWQKVDLPHDWSVRQKLDPENASSMGYLPGGIGWYKKSVVIPQQDKKIYICFEGVYNRSEVFVNGKSIGKRPNGYISFMYDITPYVQFNKANEILVRVDHHRAADSRWYTGAGIYRDVWLVYANPVHIAQWGVYAYPTLDKSTGVLNVEVDVVNTTGQQEKLTIVNELVNKQNKVVATASNPLVVDRAASKKLSTQLKVANPQMWDLNDPVLYTLRTKIIKGGKQVDANTTTTGFRQLTFDANKGFALNNKWMKVKGVCLHHDAGVLGAAMYKEVWRRRLANLKELGCNAIRTSHNPQATVFYELCDELGLLVMNEAFDEWEFPKRKWLEGWNVGTPGYQGTYDFFEEWGEKDLADMVRRDRNHISIFAWSIGNEVDYPNDPYSHPVLDGSSASGFTQKIFGGYKKDAPDAMRLGVIAKKLAATVRQYDQSRPVTAGLAGVAMSNETGYPDALDIAGYNYTESRYESDHKKYPNRVIYGSENRHDYDAWKAVTDNEHIFGQFLWTGIDYLGESGRWPSRGFYSGLLDFAGFIKPRGYFRQSLWSQKPMVYIGTYPLRGRNNSNADVLSQSEGRREEVLSMDAWSSWNYKDSQLIRVVCYTNASKARLMLNGKQIGDIKNYNNKTGIIHWDVPYQPGALKVEGLNDSDKILSTYSIQTSAEPYALKVIRNVNNSKDKVAQVAVQVVDAKGIPVTYTESEITCTITGNGTLLGLEAGDNRDMGDYTDNKQKSFRGRLIAYIKKNGKGGPVKVVLSAPQLKEVSVVL
jgi:beta-galactosidase